MVGLALLGVKCLLVTWRTFGKGSLSRRDAAEWWMIAALCTILPAVVSHFGIDNLLMPFKQVGTRAITAYSAELVASLELRSVGSRFPGRWQHISLSDASRASGCVRRRIPKVRHQAVCKKDVRADVVMEVVVALITVVMAFRFRRLVLFSALSLVPLLAAFYQSVKEALRHSERSVPVSALQADAESSTSQAPTGDGIRPGSFVAPIAAAACLTVMVFLFWRAAVVPYLPEIHSP